MPYGFDWGLNDKQESLLQEILVKVYADFGYNQEPKTQQAASADNMPVLSDLYRYLGLAVRENSTDSDFQDSAAPILQDLSFYCLDGLSAPIFDRPTNLDLDRKMTVFGLESLARTLRPNHLVLGMYLVLDYVQTSMNRYAQQSLEETQQILFVDQADIMMYTVESAQLLEELHRRAKSHKLEVSLATSKPEEFARVDRLQGKTLFDRSATKLLLTTYGSSVEALQQLLNLTFVEKDLLSSREAGEGLLVQDKDTKWFTSSENIYPGSPHQSVTATLEEIS